MTQTSGCGSCDRARWQRQLGDPRGATFDRGLLLGTDELYRERGYVGMSRGRASNHLYIVGGADIDDATGHGPQPLGVDPFEAVQQALTFETDKRLAIDTGDPIANWPIEDLVAEKHRLRRILDACPPDRTHDIRSLTARRNQLAADVEAMADRYADHSGLNLLSRTKRAEHRDLGKQLGEGTAALGRVANELRSADADVVQRERFEHDHAPEFARIGTVESELGHRIACRVELRTIDPPASYVQVLGPVPSERDGLAAWKRGALILETHHLGCDVDPLDRDWSSVLGTSAEVAATRARLEMLPHRAAEKEGQAAERENGLGLGL